MATNCPPSNAVGNWHRCTFVNHNNVCLGTNLVIGLNINMLDWMCNVPTKYLKVPMEVLSLKMAIVSVCNMHVWECQSYHALLLQYPIQSKCVPLCPISHKVVFVCSMLSLLCVHATHNYHSGYEASLDLKHVATFYRSWELVGTRILAFLGPGAFF